MESLNYTIDCWAFFSPVEWNIDSVYKYVDSVRRIYAMFGTKETHYGFAETPYLSIAFPDSLFCIYLSKRFNSSLPPSVPVVLK